MSNDISNVKRLLSNRSKHILMLKDDYWMARLLMMIVSIELDMRLKVNNQRQEERVAFVGLRKGSCYERSNNLHGCQ